MSALRIDFVEGATGYRFRSAIGRRQPLPRAAGFTQGFTPTVIDATAGLGRDAFLLASLGAEVTLIERSPAVHAALADAFARAAAARPDLAATVARMTLRHGDARLLLRDGLAADVVLVDPMHPPRGNTALVKQEMRQLRALVGADEDAADLMHAALSVASRRVVLKWPPRGAPLPGLRAPSHQILGKTVRYDVFMTPRPDDQAQPSST